MSQTEIVNDLPFACSLQHLLNTEGMPVAVALVKATFNIEGPLLRIADQQMPVLPAGKTWGEPGQSSYQYEPECSYYKPGTDVVLVGAAVPPSRITTQIPVSFSVGSLRKQALVFGDRFWIRGLAGAYLSAPEPFESIPLTYERAFGGWDRSNPDPDRHRVDPRNPLGAGFSKEFAPGHDRIPLPNIEDPSDRITDLDSRPKPVGFGFTNPEWQPRAALAGTYDSSWIETRMPLLPLDFDVRFFHAAPDGLTSDKYLLGNELVTLENCSPEPFLSFRLPGLPSPVCRFRIMDRRDESVPANLDTVVINTLDNLVILSWRCHVPIPRGPEFLKEIHISSGQ